jgi:hypothetical protein
MSNCLYVGSFAGKKLLARGGDTGRDWLNRPLTHFINSLTHSLHQAAFITQRLFFCFCISRFVVYH